VWKDTKNRAFFHVGGYDAPYYFNPVTDFESVHTVSGSNGFSGCSLIWARAMNAKKKYASICAQPRIAQIETPIADLTICGSATE
jgi:hypothetical protein